MNLMVSHKIFPNMFSNIQIILRVVKILDLGTKFATAGELNQQESRNNSRISAD